MKHAPYPNYKPSGIEWLGDVPEHWPLNRLKWSMSGSVNGVWGDEPDGENDIVCVRVADFDRRNFQVDLSRPTLRSVTPSQRRGREIRRGDLLLEKSGGGEKQMVGCMVRYDHDVPAVCSNFIARVSTASDADSQYWTYTHAALYAGKLNYPAIKQTTGIQNLDSNAYFDTAVPYPPLAEQRAIAAFLDHETARVDVLIAKKHLLIDRLAEYRTALITRTVTKGLPPDIAEAEGFDPSPRLKPSGVEWLGEVPEHWAISQLRRTFDIVNGGTPASGNERYWGGETDWLTPDDLGRNRAMWISGGRRKITRDGVQNSSAQVSPEGSIVLSTRAPIGHLAITSVPAATNQGCRTLVPATTVNGCFAYYSLLASRSVLQSLGKGSTFMELTPTDLGGHQIPLPPQPEQRAIAKFLDKQTKRIDTLSSRVKTAIERLTEYRTALITATVTGKIDIRENNAA
ncbi:MAG: restriction endonuclease subunit S [Acidimicrobiia bacterium]|nr:restriction endonuclease subunit S [Acidimicrobiia bacterium]